MAGREILGAEPDSATELDFEVGEPLTQEDFLGRCTDLAENLVGSLLIVQSGEEVVGGIIVETEAYLGYSDPACHLSHGKTKRTEPFFSGNGTVYVFKIYHHNNLNIITEYNHHPECILIRAIHPTHGIEQMRRRRGREELSELTTGPGKLTEALGITKSEHNHQSLLDSSISIHSTSLNESAKSSSPRIGISKAKSWPLRYCMEGNPYVSQGLKSREQNGFDADSYYDKLQPLLSDTLPESINQ